MIECGGLNPSKTTSTTTPTTPTTPTPTQQQPQQESETELRANNNNLNTFGPTNPEGKYGSPDLFSKCSKDVSGKWIANDGGVC